MSWPAKLLGLPKIIACKVAWSAEHYGLLWIPGSAKYSKTQQIRNSFHFPALGHIRHFDYIVYEVDSQFNMKHQNSWILYPGNHNQYLKMTIIDETGQLSEVEQPEDLRIPRRYLEEKVCELSFYYHLINLIINFFSVTECSERYEIYKNLKKVRQRSGREFCRKIFFL